MNITSITIEWDHVDCLQRNTKIDQYRIIYISNSDGTDTGTSSININDRLVFTAVGLQPRRVYMFQVRAENSSTRRYLGPFATLNVTTSAPNSINLM